MSESTGSELAMFPLGSVLFPSMLLPLHVFEDRYRQMIHRVLEGDQQFGVVIIERGPEVGGGDVRASVGCRARILDAEQQPDGRWHMVAVGVDRIRVEHWLPDDPYPRALVSDFPDAPSADVVSVGQYQELVAAFAKLMELTERLAGGTISQPLTALSDDVALATFQMAAAAPLGPLDRQRILCGEDAGVRRTLLLDAIEHATVLVNDASSN